MTLPIAYSTEASCLADRADIVAATTETGYARVFAECRKQPSNNRASAPSKPVRPKPIA